MATALSLTPRETSQGLRAPHIQSPRAGLNLPPVRGAIALDDADSDDPAPTPTREGLRTGTRMLRERRVQKSGKLGPAQIARGLTDLAQRRVGMAQDRPHHAPRQRIGQGGPQRAGPGHHVRHGRARVSA